MNKQEKQDNSLETLLNTIGTLFNSIEYTQTPREIVYIAGPISSDPDYKRKFDFAENMLKQWGYIILNPAVLPKGLEYNQYMEISGKMLDCCNVIFLLKGWAKSPGAKTELKKSIDRDIEIRDFHLWYKDRVREKEERQPNGNQ